jgi:hypothetical protein
MVLANASSYINVVSNVNRSSSSNVSSNSQTHIRIESNGQVKTYDSDKPGSVTLKTDDGKANVLINNNPIETNQITATITPIPTITEKSQGNDNINNQKIIAARLSNSYSHDSKLNKGQSPNIFDIIKSMFLSLFGHS